MRIIDLHIANFKAIDQISLEDLTDVVVIAGANGSGKSTIFDAIRFWKSTIGSYQKGELQNWLTELGFGNNNNNTSLLSAHQNKDEPFSILASISLSQVEIDYLKENARELLAFYFYKTNAQSNVMAPSVLTMQNLDLVDDFRNQKQGIMQQVEASVFHINLLEPNKIITGSVEVNPSGNINMNAPFVLQLVLSIFVDEIGIIEHYGPQRTFGREQVQSLNLAIETQVRSQRQGNVLYNQASKYSSVKTELASAYVRGLISERAGADPLSNESLEKAVTELFVQFIPGKKFMGVTPNQTGALSFDVKTSAGLHDISELSSGEKELIYGYLRLKNSGLKNSVILIDEPELHLNPRLTDGLPDFYYRHIGRPLNNQLWLVTHSDTILRQSVGYDGFRVFHMKTVGNYEAGESQIVEVTAQSEINRAIIDLVGDLAAFKPGGKLVIIEGGGASEFDKGLIQRLFPEFAQRVNLISSESKSRVQALHSLLEKIGIEGDLFSGVYAITDADDNVAAGNATLPKGTYQWDVYHIENYLVNPFFIRKVMIDNLLISEEIPESTIYDWLREAAESTKDTLIRHEMENIVRKAIYSSIKVNTDRSSKFEIAKLSEAADKSVEKIRLLLEDSLSPISLSLLKEKTESRLDEALKSNLWIDTFRGREVLNAFVDARGKNKISYESLRNQIGARMRDVEYQPIGMGQVLNAIDEFGT